MPSPTVYLAFWMIRFVKPFASIAFKTSTTWSPRTMSSLVQLGWPGLRERILYVLDGLSGGVPRIVGFLCALSAVVAVMILFLLFQTSILVRHLNQTLIDILL